MKNLFPWYDSNWLTSYAQAKHLIQTYHPSKYAEFVDALAPLRTRLDFETVQIKDLLEISLS